MTWFMLSKRSVTGGEQVLAGRSSNDDGDGVIGDRGIKNKGNLGTIIGIQVTKDIVCDLDGGHQELSDLR